MLCKDFLNEVELGFVKIWSPALIGNMGNGTAGTECKLHGLSDHLSEFET